jgi:PAT family beta-lactamase induction signal transducer AmpG
VIDLRENRVFRLALMGALYFAQGVPWGFVTVGVPLHLAGKVDQATISGVVAVAYLPWSFKWIAGPVIDRFTIRALGRRRPWILGAELGMALTLVAMLGIDPAWAWRPFLALVFLHNCCAALQDVAVDALAVDTLEEHERGTANSIMFGCKYGGNFVGGAPLVFIATRWGFDAQLIAQAAVMLAVWALVWIAREGSAAAAGTAEGAVAWGELKRSFSLPSTLMGALFVFIGSAGISLVGSLTGPYLKEELHWTDDQAAVASGGIAIAAGTLGAFSGGVISDFLGRRATLVAAAAVCGVGYAAFAWVPELRGSVGAVQSYFAVTGFFEGLFQTAMLAMCMDLTNPRIGGTQFTAYMSLSNLCSTWATWAGGQLATAWGRLAVFPIAGAAQIAFMAVLFGIRPHETSAYFREQNNAGATEGSR